MQRIILSLFLLNSAVCFGQTPAISNSPAINSRINDTLIIHGKFLDGCDIPAAVTIIEYEVMNNRLEKVNLNAHSEFEYHFFKEMPGQMNVIFGARNFDLIVTGREKRYEVEISCDANKTPVLSVLGSNENKAYQEFHKITKNQRVELDSIKNKDLNSKEIFKRLQEIFIDHDKKITNLKKEFPGTYTSEFLCPAELLSPETYKSLEMLRGNFLQREIFSSPEFFNTYVAWRAFIIYGEYLRLKSDTTFAGFTQALDIAGKNPDAAKRLQQMLFDAFYKQKREPLLNQYLAYYTRHKDLFQNPVLKAKFDRILPTSGGKLITEIELKDYYEKSCKLSETVSSGKLTVLIFYSPTCKHCKEEIPKLLPVWEEYKKKGLKIFTVGNDAKHEEWESFIKTSASTEWVNTMEAAGNVINTYTYAIDSTPTFVVIDRYGKIISRMGTVDEVIADIPGLLEKARK